MEKTHNVSCLCSILQLLRRRTTAVEEDFCDVDIGIRIRTSRDSSELMNSSSSPVSKTPTLVARLMGLESVSSESNSPSIPLSNPKPKSVFGDFAFLLPESSRRSLDSITISSSSPKRSSKRETEHFHHRRSLQIARQKENVGCSALSGRRRRRVSSRPPPGDNTRRKHLVDITNRNSLASPHKCCSNPRKPGKKTPPGTFLRPSESNPDESNCRRREKLNPSSRSLVPVKKIPSTKLPHKQVEACAALSRKQKAELRYRTSLFSQSDDDDGATTSTAAAECKRYVGRILKRAGLLMNPRRRPLFLSPSIFYYLELFPGVAGGDLSRRCNRRLIFDLVDEILAGARFDSKRWVGFAMDEIWKEIEKLPAAAKCEYVGDVDGRRGWNGTWGEESEGVAREIEGEVVDSLIDETVAVVAGARTKKTTTTRRGKTRRRVARNALMT